MNRARRGLTLVELLVVVGVVAILTGMGINALSDLKRHGEVSGEVRKMMVMLRNARTLSIITGVRHGVYYGGPTDAQNAGAGGDPDLRNRLIVFRKPAIGSTATDYQDGDWRQDERPLPSGPGGYNDALLRFNLLETNPGGSVRVVFDEDGRPTVNVASGGSSTVVPFPGGTNPLVLVLRNPAQDPAAQNATRRCLSLDVSGEVRMLQVCP